MIVLIILAVIGGLCVTSTIALFAVGVVCEVRTQRAVRKQADWDDHVEQAVRLSETPLYERIAHEYAKDLDAEWANLNRGAAQ